MQTLKPQSELISIRDAYFTKHKTCMFKCVLCMVLPWLVLLLIGFNIYIVAGIVLLSSVYFYVRSNHWLHKTDNVNQYLPPSKRDLYY